MPERNLKPDGNPSLSAALTTVAEQVYALTEADGVAIALRDSQGVRCLASVGDAPAVGSRLEPDSDFTKECLESGSLMLCLDTEGDSRIRPSIARVLHLRSVVAVPIEAQGFILGVLEVFSSRPSAFDTKHIVALRQIADLLAPVAAAAYDEASGPNPGVSRCAAGRSSSSDAEEQSREGLIDAPRPAMDRTSPSTRAWLKIVRAGTLLTRWSKRLTRNTTAARVWLSGAATLFFLGLLFLIGESGPRAVRTSSRAAVLPASREAIHRKIVTPPVEAKTRDGIELPNPNRGNHSLLPAASISVESAPGSKSAKRELRNASSHKPDRVLEGGYSAMLRASPTSRANPSATQPVATPAAAAGHNADVLDPTSSAPVVEGTKLTPFEPSSEPALAALSALTPAATLLASARNSQPDFVLDHTLKGHSGWVTGVAFSSDGRRLASGSWDQTVKFWDVPTGQELSTIGAKMKEVQAVALSHDGRWLAAENSSDTVTLWDAATSREIRTLSANKPLGVLGSNWVYSIAFSPDGRRLASGVDDRTVRLWDLATGRAVRDLTSLRRSVMYAAFSPDGHWLASGDDDRSIGIWDVSSGEELRKLNGHKKTIYAVVFSPNGRWLASASADKTIKLWDVDAGREIHTLTGHRNLVTSLAFSPDGRWLASGSWDKTIKIWNVETGHEVQTLNGHDRSIYTVAFGPYGQWLASGSEDGTIKLWRWVGIDDPSRAR